MKDQFISFIKDEYILYFRYKQLPKCFTSRPTTCIKSTFCVTI